MSRAARLEAVVEAVSAMRGVVPAAVEEPLARWLFVLLERELVGVS